MAQYSYVWAPLLIQLWHFFLKLKFAIVFILFYRSVDVKKHKKYSEEQIRKAINDVEKEVDIHKVPNFFKMFNTTLQRKTKKWWDKFRHTNVAKNNF